MPPKDKKEKKGKKRKEPEKPPEPVYPESLMSVIEKDLDLINDLNDDFFLKATKVRLIDCDISLDYLLHVCLCLDRTNSNGKWTNI